MSEKIANDLLQMEEKKNSTTTYAVDITVKTLFAKQSLGHNSVLIFSFFHFSKNVKKIGQMKNQFTVVGGK